MPIEAGFASFTGFLIVTGVLEGTQVGITWEELLVYHNQNRFSSLPASVARGGGE